MSVCSAADALAHWDRVICILHPWKEVESSSRGTGGLRASGRKLSPSAAESQVAQSLTERHARCANWAHSVTRREPTTKHLILWMSDEDILPPLEQEPTRLFEELQSHNETPHSLEEDLNLTMNYIILDVFFSPHKLIFAVCKSVAFKSPEETHWTSAWMSFASHISVSSWFSIQKWAAVTQKCAVDVQALSVCNTVQRQCSGFSSRPINTTWRTRWKTFLVLIQFPAQKGLGNKFESGRENISVTG